MSTIRVRLREKGSGAHSIYGREDGCLVVEWYDFGEEVPYESANMLVMTAAEQAVLGEAIGLSPNTSAGELAAALADRFPSYWDIRRFLDERRLPYTHSVDFQP
ncbi:MAG TPA: hypothetical protein VIJ94_01560 [Caulobacteraceae bacterium]